jgi:ketosteroid isomerase-like protein
MSGEQLMRTIVAAWEKSDLQPLFAALHDDVVWKTASRYPGGPFSFKGDYTNRAGILDVLSNIAKDYTFYRMTPIQILEGPGVVWGLFDTALAYDPKGRGVPAKTMEMEWVVHWKLKDGKIIEHQAFFDTAYLLMQQTTQH